MTAFSKPARRLLATTAVVATLVTSGPAAATSDPSTPSWTPKSSERLVKLPASYLEKSLQQEFNQSSLGQALRGTETDIGLKTSTLIDLQAAIEEAEGPMRIELRHQFLAEKRNYLDLMQQRVDIRRSEAETKTKLFEDMLETLAAEKAADTPARRALVERQKTARDRLDRTIDAVDTKLFETVGVRESRYSTKYAENVASIEKLRTRFRSHKMNNTVDAEGETLTKDEYVRMMLADAQSELAILEQEETVIGFMAKLVALDALQLNEEAMDAEIAGQFSPPSSGPSGAVDLFLSN